MADQERAIGVVLEGVESSLKLVAEGHGALNEKFDRLEKKVDVMAKDIDVLKVDMSVLKVDMSVMKNDMRRVKQRLDLNGEEPKRGKPRRR